MAKLIFVLVFILVFSALIGYLNINGLLSGFTGVFANLGTFLTPFIAIYNVIVSYPNCMIFIMAFLGANVIRYILHKLGVYGND